MTFAKIAQYHEALDTLPAVDRPGVFGLHDNADITCQTQMAGHTLSTILDIQPKESGGGGGESREDAVTRMCIEFLEKLPADFVAHEVKDRLKKMGAYTSMNIFLRQEIDNMQAIIGLVRHVIGVCVDQCRRLVATAAHGKYPRCNPTCVCLSSRAFACYSLLSDQCHQTR